MALFALLLAGCPSKEEADSGPTCEDTPTTITADEATSLGFTITEVLAALPAGESTEFAYADGTTTPLEVAFVPGTAYRFVDSEAVYPEGMTTDIGILCEDRLEVDGTLHFATEDGAFAEDFAVTLTATTVDEARIWQELDLDGLTGTFDIVPFVDATDYDELKAWISAVYAGGVSTGSVEGQASGAEECDPGDTCTAWAENVSVGTWPSAE